MIIKILWYVLNTSVGSEPKLGSARLGSVLARAFGKKSLAWLSMPSKKLDSARHILQKKLGSARLASIIQKTGLPWKAKKELISNIFVNFLRYNPKDIIKSVFFLLKSWIL